MDDPKIGQKIYIDSHFYISHGSDDVVGGLATVTKITKGISGGEKCSFVTVKEHPDHSYNWTQMLSKEQNELKKKFGNKDAQTHPDIDAPWIEEGDIVNGVVYHGDPIW